MFASIYNKSYFFDHFIGGTFSDVVTDRSRVHMDLLPSQEENADLYAKDDSIAFVDSILTGYEKKKVLMERFMEKGLPEQTHLKRSTGFER